MFRFKLGQLALAMAAIGVGLAALVRATPAWVSLVYTASLAAFTAATLAALFAPRRSRPFWAGAALTALIYVVAARSFPRPLETAPAWAIRTWAEGNGPTVFDSLKFVPATTPTAPITTTTAVTPPADLGPASSDAGGLAPLPQPASSPTSIYSYVVTSSPGMVPSNPSPATLQQAAAPTPSVYDPTWISFSTIAPTTPIWSRGNAGLIAEMGAVWLAALAGGWLARRLAARAEMEAVDGRAG